MTVTNLFKFSAQESNLVPFIGNGAKVKIRSEIKPPFEETGRPGKEHKRSVNFKRTFWCHRLDQKTNEIFFKRFLPWPLKRGQIKKLYYTIMLNRF